MTFPQDKKATTALYRSPAFALDSDERDSPILF